MKQASRNKEKHYIPSHLSQRLREVILILILALAGYALLALLTYHGSDPGWSSTGSSKHIANSAGQFGAWIADLALYLFGYLAYLFPIMLAYSGWISFYHSRQNRPFLWHSFLMRLVGFIFVLFAGCGFVNLHVPTLHEHVPFTSGGVVGELVIQNLINVFSAAGSSLLLLAVFCSGVTLFSGLSWFKAMDATGRLLLNITQKCKNAWQRIGLSFRSWRNKKQEQNKAKEPTMDEPLLKVAIKPAPSKRAAVKPVISSPAVAEVETATPAKIAVSATKPKAVTETKPPKINPPIPRPVITPAPYSEHSGEQGLPSVTLLDLPEINAIPKGYSPERLEEMSREVEIRLKDFGVEVQVVAVHPGPVITRFEMQLAPGLKVSRITSLAKDLARSLSVVSVRVVEVIPGKSVVGLELPNEDRESVVLREIVEPAQFAQTRSPLTLALGKDIAGHPVIVDLAKMPHLLVAGTTGSGKSVGINAMLIGLLYKAIPEEVRFVLIDPKMLELSVYEGIPHLLTPVITDMRKAGNALRWCVAEMEKRYKLMSMLGVRNLAGYNQKIKEAPEPIPDPTWQGPVEIPAPKLTTLPFIVVVIDEYADLMMVIGKKVEQLIARIAQKARAAGIHLILATQRPSVDVITGLIKANIPTRIAFQVSSKIDSRTILDQAGAEQLLGAGDMLYLPPGTSVPVRVHGAYVSDNEVHKVVADWRLRGSPDYLVEIVEESDNNSGEEGSSDSNSGSEQDPLYDQAVRVVTLTRRATISSIQRRLKIGYNRAARMVEDMETAGIVGSMESNGTREVLAPPPPDN